MEMRHIYQLKQAVWEITYKCNMRCKHCGSSCGELLKDELTTEEALRVCDDLGKLKLRSLTLSGGEPFMRPDWPVLAKRLERNGVRVNCISNGWFIDERLIETAKEAGVINIGISIDGLKTTHDFLRMNGSFEKAMAAFSSMKSHKMPTVACTTINRRNLGELPLLRELLIGKGVEQWQFQIALPMGNMLHHPELVVSPEDLVLILDFCYETMKEGKICVCLTDCLGYYTVKDREIRQHAPGGADGIWRGCQAGKEVVGIRANGDILGCLSIRDDSFIEGNVRNVPLAHMWNRSGAFDWNRSFTKDKLTGFCSVCQYGDSCLGGCSNSKITMHHCVTQNDYCLFSSMAKREMKLAKELKDIGELIGKARRFIASKDHQFADVYLRRAFEISPKDIEVLQLLGFVNYFMANYDASKTFNEMVLKIEPSDPYALKGYGLCLERQGDIDGAMKYLRKAIKASKEDNGDLYHDFSVICDRYHLKREAHV